MAAASLPGIWAVTNLDVVLSPEELRDQAKIQLAHRILDRAHEPLGFISKAWLFAGLCIVAVSIAGLIASGQTELRVSDRRRVNS